MAKETAIKTFVIVAVSVATLVSTLLIGGARLGATEQAAKQHQEQIRIMSARQDVQEKTTDIMREEQAYQKGVVSTKLDNIQKKQDQMYDIIIEWEPE